MRFVAIQLSEVEKRDPLQQQVRAEESSSTTAEWNTGQTPTSLYLSIIIIMKMWGAGGRWQWGAGREKKKKM